MRRAVIPSRSFHPETARVAAAEPNITIVEAEVDGIIKAEHSHQVVGIKSVRKGARDYFFASLAIAADEYKSKFRAESAFQKPVSKSKFWALELRDVTVLSPCFGHVILGNFSSAPSIKLAHPIQEH